MHLYDLCHDILYHITNIIDCKCHICHNKIYANHTKQCSWYQTVGPFSAEKGDYQRRFFDFVMNLVIDVFL